MPFFPYKKQREKYIEGLSKVGLKEDKFTGTQPVSTIECKYGIKLGKNAIKFKASDKVESVSHSMEECLSYIKNCEDIKIIKFAFEFLYNQKLIRGINSLEIESADGSVIPLDSLSKEMILFISCIINSSQGIYTKLERYTKEKVLTLLDSMANTILLCYDKSDRACNESDLLSVHYAVDYPIYDFKLHKSEVINWIENNTYPTNPAELITKDFDKSEFEDGDDSDPKIKVVIHTDKELPKSTCRILPMLVIGFEGNGDYHLETMWSCKYPLIEDFIYEFGVDFTEEEQCERGVCYHSRLLNGKNNVLVVVIDTDEGIAGLEDLEKTLYGFYFLDNVLHIYWRDDILRMFAERLKNVIKAEGK